MFDGIELMRRVGNEALRFENDRIVQPHARIARRQLHGAGGMPRGVIIIASMIEPGLPSHILPHRKSAPPAFAGGPAWPRAQIP